MDIKTIENTVKIENPGGEETVYEFYKSEGLGFAVARLSGKSLSHKHPFEELYYFTKGDGILYIGDEQQAVKEGMFIPIPQDVYHHLEVGKEDLELVVVTHPSYDPDLVVYED